MLWGPSSEQTNLGSGQTPATHLGESPQSCRCQQWGPGKGWRGGNCSVDILSRVLPRPPGLVPSSQRQSRASLRVQDHLVLSLQKGSSTCMVETPQHQSQVQVKIKQEESDQEFSGADGQLWAEAECAQDIPRVLGWLRSYWDEALVAREATQCWKLGDTAAVQPSLWCGSLAAPPASASAVQGGSGSVLLPQLLGLALLIHSAVGLPACSAGSRLGLGRALSPAAACPAFGSCRMVAMWFRRSVKNSLTPS